MTSDLKLRALLAAWRTPIPDPKLSIRDFEPVISAHRRNLRRVHALTHFPMALISGLTIVHRNTRNVLDAIGADKNKSISKDEIKRRVVAAMTETMDERDEILNKKDEKADALREVEEKYAIETINIFLSTDMSDGADAWLSAQITGIWTSCEAMAEDLWETALNIHPLGLAELGGANKGQQEKSIKLNKLSRWKYDVSKCMGTILKEKYNFDSLEGKRSVREAYADAFNNDGINSIIGHKSFTALNLVRNLIVHTGGICDENYLRRKADLPPAAIGKLGSPLIIDGELTAALIVEPMHKSVELIIAVDRWISDAVSASA